MQAAIADCLADRTRNAHRDRARAPPRPDSAGRGRRRRRQRRIRARLQTLAAAAGLRLVAPPPRLCTDNAAMIAWAGIERLRRGLTDGLDFAPRPRWPLDPSAPRAIGAGVKA